MEPKELLKAMEVAVRLKDTTRHCYTEKGRRESVAEHCWLMTLMALLLRHEFPGADMDKVIRMCLIHDLGECFTGDIPTFEKGAKDEDREHALLNQWVDSLPREISAEFRELFREMEARQTEEAKIYKALDGLEAVFQHNRSDLSTWLPLEYELNQTYAQDRVQFSEYLTQLRQLLREQTREKIARG